MPACTNDDPERLARIAEGLGIGRARRHIFLCCDQTEPKCAARETGLESWARLKRLLVELKLPDVLRTKANCLRVCEQGPIAVVYPEGTWYHSVTPALVERIVREHLIEGRPVEEYIFARGPLPPDGTW